MAKRIPLPDRFWTKVREDGDCWVWTASRDKVSGYGRIQVDHQTKYAHRIAYELMIGEIPDGLHIDHLCRNRACVNPYHLEPVTPAENVRRSPIAHGSESHCPAGHEYAGTNLMKYSGRRYCRTCNTAAVRAWHKARRTAAQTSASPATPN